MAVSYRVRTLQGDTIDMVCLRVQGRLIPGMVEATLAANPGLADLGPIYDTGVELTLPELAEKPDNTIKLWD
jgi:phage tail protein X